MGHVHLSALFSWHSLAQQGELESGVLVRQHVPSVLGGLYPCFPSSVDWKEHSRMTDTNPSLSSPTPTTRLHHVEDCVKAAASNAVSPIYNEGPCPHPCITYLLMSEAYAFSDSHS